MKTLWKVKKTKQGKTTNILYHLYLELKLSNFEQLLQKFFLIEFKCKRNRVILAKGIKVYM